MTSVEFTAEQILDQFRSDREILIEGALVIGDLDFGKLGKEFAVQGKVRFRNTVFEGKINVDLSSRISFLRNVYFGDCEFKQGCDFSRAEFQQDVEITKCIFREHLDFWQTNFCKSLHISFCSFVGSESVRLFGTQVYQAEFYYCEFCGNIRSQDACFGPGHSSFTGCKFMANTYFGGSSFKGTLAFDGSVFKSGKTGLHNCKFEGYVSFLSATINAPIRLTSSDFIEGIDLSETVITAPIILIGSTIQKTMAFREVILESRIEVDWSDIKSATEAWCRQYCSEDVKDGQLGNYPKKGREAVVKDALVKWSENLKNTGRIRDSRKAWYLWTQITRISNKNSALGRVSDWFLDLPSDRGTRPSKPFWMGLAIVATFSLVIGSVGIYEAPPISAPVYYPLLASIDAFLPAGEPTLVGDWIVRDKYQWLLQLESVIGWLWTGLAAWSIRESFF